MVESDLMKWNKGILRKIKGFWYLMRNVFFCLLTFNSRADIISRYNFSQVRCFFTFSIDFMAKWDTPVKDMNNKFQVLTNIYVCTGYFIGFTFLENVVFLVRYLPVMW